MIEAPVRFVEQAGALRARAVVLCSYGGEGSPGHDRGARAVRGADWAGSGMGDRRRQG